MKKLVAALFILLLILPAMAEELKDPYEVLKKELELRGGKEKLESITSSETNQTIEIKAQGQKMNRTENSVFFRPDTSTVKFYQKTSSSRGDYLFGYNGEVAWKVENGEYSLIEDEEEKEDVEEKKESMYDQYEYLNPDSPYYSVKLKGIKKVSGRKCYYIRIKNKDKGITTKRYIDIETFDVLKDIRTDENGTRETKYSDYKTVDGFRNPYKKEVLVVSYDNPEPVNYKIIVTSLNFNRQIDESIFEPREQK